MSSKYTEEELLEHLHQLADELGKDTPTLRDMQEIGDYPESAYRNKFGSWNEAVERAGLDVNKNTDYTEEELLGEVNRLAEEVGRVPDVYDLREEGKFSKCPYRQTFGGWNNALREAGYEPNQRWEYSREELLELIYNCSIEYIKRPSYLDMREFSGVSQMAFINEFGSWRDALEECNFRVPEEGDDGGHRRTDDEILLELYKLARTHRRRIDDLRQKHLEEYDTPLSSGYVHERFGDWDTVVDKLHGVAHYEYIDLEMREEMYKLNKKLGRTPTSGDFDEYSDMSHKTVQERMGSWKEFLDFCKLKKSKAPAEGTSRPNISREKLINELKTVGEKLGRPLSTKDVKQHARFAYSTYARRFGGLEDALEEAGLERTTLTPQKIQKEELLEELRRLNEELDRPPKRRDIKELGEFSYTPYMDRFGGLKEALAEASIETEVGDRGRIQRERLVEELERLHNELGEAPRTKDMTEKGKYSYDPYKREFNSWGDALEEAGIEHSRNRISNEKLLSDLRELHIELGEVPSTQDMNKSGGHSATTYIDRFGSWEEALREAGIRDTS